MRSEGIVIRKRPSLFLVMAIGLALLLAVRDIGGVGLPKFIYLGYIVFFMAIANYETLVNMLCFIFPLVCGLPGTYIMPCALALLFIKRKRINMWQLGLLLFVATMEFLAALWYPTISFPNIIQYISFAGVMFFLIHDDTELDFLRCVRSYFWGVCLLCAIILTTGIMTAPSDWMTLFARGAFRFGETQAEMFEGMKLSLNANSLGYYSITGITCGVFIAETEKGVWRAIFIMLTVFAAIAGFLTISRSWLIVAVICLFVYIISKLRNLKQLVGIALICVILLGVGSIVLESFSGLLEGFVTRFSTGDVEGGNGRVDVALQYIELFFDDAKTMLVGAGVTQYREVLGSTTSTHNGTIQVFVCLGLCGAAIFLGGLIAPITRQKKRGTRFIQWLPLIGVALFIQTVQFLNPCYLMLPYSIAVLSLKSEKQKSEEIE